MQQANILETPLTYLKGVGPKRADILFTELGLKTFEDLLYYFPFRYIDRSKFYKINELTDFSINVQIKGVIKNGKELGQGRGKRYVAQLVDETGSIDLVWFKGIKWIKDKFNKQKEYVVYGKPTLFNGRINITHPEINDLEVENTTNSKLQAVYHSSEKLASIGLTTKGIQKIIATLLNQVANIIPENLNQELITSYKLLSRKNALVAIHLPQDVLSQQKAEIRLKYEELFFIQLRLIVEKIIRTYKTPGYYFERVGDYFNTFYKENLPFTLTNAQKRVIKEIRQDFASKHHMNRLLQGDVGSGKTLVALMSMLIAADNNYQSSLMAPTEILAQQHLVSIQKFLKGMDIRVELLTGSTTTAKRKRLLEDLKNGEIQILIGTHALIEDRVVFKNLGFVVIDEQHRFGVQQRAKLWKKNKYPPHILVMTATPIPRTMAMTLYGDLDYSVIDELPPGRKPIQTFHYFDSKRIALFGFMKKQIAEGRQIYVVYPLINESETLDLKDLTDGYNSITRAFPPPQYQVSIVHGQMKAADKEYEMNRFKNGETQIMVSTTVIEVGVDVPNASVMVIENAERFGLSQLHQLRGRVGRGADQSFCILMTSYKLSNEGKTRIETMVRTNDGFEIAEADLRLRGPGDLQGTQQSGILALKIADLIKDEKILKAARHDATSLLKDDPKLSKEENKPIRKHLSMLQKTKVNWGIIS
ncbi:MAG: ATP-dependent DNA helicase RecG [Bacteroidetes bacterium]|nr:MAG: ATP-dependent DNA helicase RecG [Bacteroidota bacterium]